MFASLIFSIKEETYQAVTRGVVRVRGNATKGKPLLTRECLQQQSLEVLIGNADPTRPTPKGHTGDGLDFIDSQVLTTAVLFPHANSKNQQPATWASEWARWLVKWTAALEGERDYKKNNNVVHELFYAQKLPIDYVSKQQH